MPTIISPVDRLAELFASAGAGDYLGEPVTVAQHLLQSAALARAAGAPAALVAAALLHDAGHLRGADPLADEPELSGRELMAGTDNDQVGEVGGGVGQFVKQARVVGGMREHSGAGRGHNARTATAGADGAVPGRCAAGGRGLGSPGACQFECDTLSGF
jgi:predicted HD phosphohydrolase